MGRAGPSLVYEVSFEEARERRLHDRRAGERRMAHENPKLGLDPLFAATLVNHIAAPERAIGNNYRTQRALGAGVVINLNA